MSITPEQLANWKNEIKEEMRENHHQIEKRIDSIVNDLDKHVEEARLVFTKTRDDIDSRVTYKAFYWIVGILMTITIGLFGIIWAELRTNSGVLQNVVGQLQALEIIR